MARGSPFTALCRNLGTPTHIQARADLHMHSTHSDGLYTVEQLANLGKRAGLLAMALTDHDTLAGWPGFAQAVSAQGMEPVAGVEITCSLNEREIHLLGLFVDPSHLGLADRLDRVRQARLIRYRHFLDRLESTGLGSFEDHWAEIREISEKHPGRSLGRRTLAAFLVKRQLVASIRVAFERWLGPWGKEIGEEARVCAEEAIDLVHQAGGIASWAHPGETDFGPTLQRLIDWDLDAIEAEYPDFKNRRIRELKRLARENGLEITGGSDCHGPGPRYPGSTSVDTAEWSRLKARLSGRHVSSAI